MSVWTLSWQAGTGGEEVGRELAERVGVPLVDRELIDALAEELGLDAERACQLERGVPGRLEEAGISLACLFNPMASAQLRLAAQTRAVTEKAIRQAARHACVVLGRAGFAVLADHPGACHLRLLAPFEWRAKRYAAESLTPIEAAR